MINLKKKILIIMGVFAIATPVITTEAREIKDLTNFNLPAYKGINFMPQALKSANAGATIINLKEIDGQGTGSYALDGYLVNSNGEQRGDYTSGIKENKRTAISNWSSAKKGYYYRFRCMNHNSVSLNAYVNGSWSPDAN